jgi:hypothetical protein
MKELLGFAAFYIVLICLFLFVMLFGECSFFEGTVVSRAHACLTGGLCEAGSDAVERYCGERGKRCVAATTTQCCDRPNPALQVRSVRGACERAQGFAAALFRVSRASAQCVYIALVTVGYFVFLRDAAPLLPGPYASEVHLCVARGSCARLCASHAPMTAAGRGLLR